MKLHIVGFSKSHRGDLLVTIAALTDDGEPLGFEDKVNLSRARDRERFANALVEEMGVSQERARAAVAQVLKDARTVSDEDASSRTDYEAIKARQNRVSRRP